MNLKDLMYLKAYTETVKFTECIRQCGSNLNDARSLDVPEDLITEAAECLSKIETLFKLSQARTEMYLKSGMESINTKCLKCGKSFQSNKWALCRACRLPHLRADNN